MAEPIFWLGLSILLVAVCLAAVLVAALPALQELARAARSVEKLADTLNRELPPTLEAIRLTGLEISDLTDDISEGVQSAGQVVRQVDQGLSGARQQVTEVQVSTRSVVAGFKAAWRSFTRPRRKLARGNGRSERIAANRMNMEFQASYSDYVVPMEPAEGDDLEGETASDPGRESPENL